MANYNTNEIRNKYVEALRKATEEVKNGTVNTVSISKSNIKMGAVASVSLLPLLTCPSRCNGTCGESCYASKIANMRTSVRVSYARNTALAMCNPDLFWQGVKYALMGVRFFRFHVSGDILNADYFERMIDACKSAPHCEILVFTKRYEIVNEWIAKNGDLPENLHLLFSGWTNLKTINPHELPETNIFDADHEAKEDWLICGGNCFECGCRGVGCWQARKGQTIAFKKH